MKKKKVLISLLATVLCAATAGTVGLFTGTSEVMASAESSSVSWDIHKTGEYAVTDSVSIDQAKVVIDKQIPVANLKDNVLKFTFLPDEANKSVASWMTVHVRDSADPTKVVTVVYGGQSGGRTKTMVTMYEDVVRNDDWGNYYIYQNGTKTQYCAVGADNWQNYSWDNQIYRRNSSLAVSDGYSSENGLFRYVDSIDEIDTLTLQYGFESEYGMTSIDETRKKYSGARLDKLVDDANVYSNNADDIARHGEEVFADTYQNVFSSGYVTISIELYYQYDSGKVTAEASEFSGNLIIYEVGGEAITEADLVDTLAPVIHDPNGNYVAATEKLEVKAAYEYSVNDFFSWFSASDNIASNPLLSVKLYNKNGEEQTLSGTVVFSEGDYVIVTAEDAAGNKAERKFPIILSSTEVAEEYFLEISEDEVAYCVLNQLPLGYSYTASLHLEEDSSFASPLSTNGTYCFENLGDYRLKIILYDADLNAETKYTWLRVVDTQIPSMSFNEEYKEEYSINEKVSLLQPIVTDNYKKGECTLTVTVKIGDNDVEIQDNSIVLESVGIYTVTYTATDASGNTREEVKTIVNNGTDYLKPIISFFQEYKDSYNVGDEITVIQPTVTDNASATPTLEVEAYRNGEKIDIVNGVIKVTKGGNIKIIYMATDDSGNIESVVKTLVVDSTNSGNVKNGGCGGCNGSITTVTTLISVLGVMVLFMGIKAYRRKGE